MTATPVIKGRGRGAAQCRQASYVVAALVQIRIERQVLRVLDYRSQDLLRDIALGTHDDAVASRLRGRLRR